MRRYYNPTRFTGLFGMQEEQHLNGKFERRTSNHEQQIAGKRLITIGIYTALYIVAIFVASVANVTPLTFMFYSRYFFFDGAVFFIMLATKVQKFGAVIIWGRDCWLALFGAWHGINTSVFCCCLYHCTIHPFKKVGIRA